MRELKRTQRIEHGTRRRWARGRGAPWGGLLAVLLAVLVSAGLPRPGAAQPTGGAAVGAVEPVATVDSVDSVDAAEPVDAVDSVDAADSSSVGLSPAEARLAPSTTVPKPNPPVAPDGLYLMDIKENVMNWDQAAAGTRDGLYGWDWPASMPCGNGTRTWSGVLCRGGDVIQVNLANLGLKGELSVEVIKVPTLEGLDLSGNEFEGFLPPQWSSKSLRRLILSNNKLSGNLPAAYGEVDTFPEMERMMVDGNRLDGMLPGSQWLSSGFKKQAVITLRPGNEDLCGSVPVVDPKYYTSLPDAELFGGIEGLPVFLPDSAFAVNTSQVYLVYTNLFAMTPQVAYPGLDAGKGGGVGLGAVGADGDDDADDADDRLSSLPDVDDVLDGIGEAVAGIFGRRRDRSLLQGQVPTAQAMTVIPDVRGLSDQGTMYPNPTNVVITNTLGTCSSPCGKRAALPSSNLLEAAWMFNVTLTDILRYNSGLSAANAQEGTVIALPCYNEGVPFQSTSDAASGMFAGGNQRTVVGTVGAEIAGAVVRGNGLPVKEKDGIYFEGVKDYLFYDGAMHTVLVEPVYWFVDLGADFTVTGVTITGGEPMNGLSIFVGSDTSSVFANSRGASGLNFAAGETRLIPVPYLKGSYVILYAEANPSISLANVKVWTAEGNAAAGKRMRSSSNMDYLSMSDDSYGQIVPETSVVLDATSDSCHMLGSKDGDGSKPFYVEVDNGSDMGVNSVAVDVRNLTVAASGKNATVAVFTSNSPYDSSSMEDVNICKLLSVEEDSTQITAGCALSGRYVGLRFDNVQTTEVCNLAVYVTRQDIQAATVTITGADIVGIVVGSVLGGAALALLLVGAYWWRKRRSDRKIAANKEVYHDAEKGVILPPALTSLKMVGRNGSHTSQHSGSSLSPHYLKQLQNMDPFTDYGNVSRDHSSSMDQSPTRRDNSFTNGMSRSENLSTSISSSVDCIDFSDIELLRTIGEGSYGLVWLGRYLQTSVAVKVLTHDTKRTAGWHPEQAPSDGALMALQKEASIMASLRHPNCVQYLGCCIDPPALVMEFCSRKSVDKILQDARRDPRAAMVLDWVHLLGIAADAAKGMLYLHTRSPPIIHRDLKSPNLLVDALWHVKISDFNLSRAMEQESFSTSLAITNPRWLAPEVLRGEHGGRAADVYSFGVVLWELMTWRLPWGEETNPFSIINGVLNGKNLVIPGPEELHGGELPAYDQYVALIKDCWSMEAADRPSMDHVASELRSMLSGMLTTKINTSKDDKRGEN